MFFYSVNFLFPVLPWTIAEGLVGPGRDLPLVLQAESIGPKFLGLRPELGVEVEARLAGRGEEEEEEGGGGVGGWCLL